MVDNGLSRIQAAVLIPLYRGPHNELKLVLIRRGEGGRHGGQIAFPGGKAEPEDRSPLETALRETEEEIGLARERVRVLAALQPVETLTSDFLIHPFLAQVKRPASWQPQAGEVAEVLEVSLTGLAHPTAHGEEVMDFPAWPQPRQIPFYRIGRYRLWGATYRILQPLLPRLLAGEWPL